MNYRFTSDDFKKLNLVPDPDNPNCYIKQSKLNAEAKTITPAELDKMNQVKRQRGRTKLDFAIKEVKPKNSTELVIQWADKQISLNEWYSSKHWSERNRISKQWHKFFSM